MKIQARFRIKLKDRVAVTEGEATSGFRYTLHNISVFYILKRYMFNINYLPSCVLTKMEMTKARRDTASHR